MTSRDTIAHTGRGDVDVEVLHAIAAAFTAVVTLALLRELAVPDNHLRGLVEGHLRFTSARFVAERHLARLPQTSCSNPSRA